MSEKAGLHLSSEEKEKQVRNSLLYVFPQVIVSLTSVLALSIFTRVLSQEAFGYLALAQIYGVFMAGLSNFGLLVVYNRNFFQYRDTVQAASLLYSTILFVLAVSLMLLLVTSSFQNLFAQWVIGEPGYGRLLFWAYCAAVMTNIKTYFLRYYRNSEDAKAFAFITVGEHLLFLVLSVMLLVYWQTGVIGLLWGQFFAGVVVTSILVVRFRAILPFSFDWSILKHSLRLGYPLTPRVFLGIISSQFDKYMIGLLATVGGVGIYSIGQRIANLVFTYMNTLQNVFQPQVYKRMFSLGKDGGDEIGQYLTPFVYLSLLPAMLLVLFVHEALIVLTPPSYHGAEEIIIVLAMYYGILFFGKQPQLIYAEKTMVTTVLSFFPIILNISLNIPFIIKWGALGAAWATLLSGMISGTVSFVISQYYYRIGWEYGKIGMVYLLFFMTALILLVMKSLASAYFLLILVKITALALYIVLGNRLGIITLDNMQLLKKNLFLKRLK